MSGPHPVDDSLGTIPIMDGFAILMPCVLIGASFAPVAASAGSERTCGGVEASADWTRLRMPQEHTAVSRQRCRDDTLRGRLSVLRFGAHSGAGATARRCLPGCRSGRCNRVSGMVHRRHPSANE
ncbi:MAG: hypothetical protein ACJAZO_000132 [Myxococcota bacterium]|jgi:hypothetical protein